MIDPVDDLARLEPYLGEFAQAALVEGEDAALLCAVCLRETEAGHAHGYVVPEGVPPWLGRGDRGHGFGLFQIDDRGPYAYLPRDAPEATPELQARWACAVLRDARLALLDLRSRSLWERAVVCAYNNGGPLDRSDPVRPRNTYRAVRRALEIGANPDLVTTGSARHPEGDYGSDVLARRDRLRREHPERFPPPRNQQLEGGVA